MSDYNFIDANPSERDLFEGKSHENIANSIIKIITINKNLNRQIIGLEGNWGSGKSSIIKILEKQLEKKNFLIFNYDVWGNQEDLSNKTFLEELMTFLKKKGFLSPEECQEKVDKLFAKQKSTKVEKIPKINIKFIGVILFGIIIYKFLLNFSKIIYIFSTSNELYASSDESKIECLFFSVIFCIFLYLSKTHKDKIFEFLSIYKGEYLEEKIDTTIVESEARSVNFRRYLNDLDQKLQDKNQNLIIVFDNLDRLDSIKLSKLWATIHTFFAETMEKKNEKIWTIIPYDRKKLILQNDDKEDLTLEEKNALITKTIAINFMISEPILSDWKKFFDNSINKAFPSLSNSQKQELKNIFDKAETKKTPRKIITYINDIVALKVSNCNEDIPIKYYGLFRYLKFELQDSLDILKTNFDLKEVKKIIDLFNGDKDWRKFISGLYFNVSLDKAGEILIFEECKGRLLSGEPIDELMKYPDFEMVLEKVLGDLRQDIKKDIIWEKVFKNLMNYKNIKEYSYIKSIYDLFIESFLTKNDYNNEYKEEYILLYILTKDARFRNNMKMKLQKNLTENKIEIPDYMDILKRIEFKDFDKIKVSENIYFENLKYNKDTYKTLNFKIDFPLLEKEIIKIFQEYREENKELIETFKYCLRDNPLKFPNFINILKNYISTSYMQNNQMYYALLLLNQLNNNEIIDFLKSNIISYWSSYISNSQKLNQEIGIIIFALNIDSISYNQYNEFINTSPKDIKYLSEIFIRYANYETLLKMNLKEPRSVLLKMLTEYIITNNIYGDRINILSCLNEYEGLKKYNSNNLIINYHNNLFEIRDDFNKIDLKYIPVEFIKDAISLETTLKDILIAKFKNYSWESVLKNNDEILKIIPEIILLDNKKTILKEFYEIFYSFLFKEDLKTNLSTELFIKLLNSTKSYGIINYDKLIDLIIANPSIENYFEHYSNLIFTKYTLEKLQQDQYKNYFCNIFIPIIKKEEQIDYYNQNIETLEKIITFIKAHNIQYYNEFKEILEKTNINLKIN